MGNNHDKEYARAFLSLPQMITFIVSLKAMLLAKDEWQKVLSYQELSSHPSLPLNVQESQHMMMIAVWLLREWSSRTSAKDLQAYRPCILGVSLMGRKIQFRHNLVAAHCRP